MPSGMTKTEVCNLALDLIRSSPLISADDTTTSEGRFLNRNFAHTARVIMRAYPWNFAKRYYKLNAAISAPLFKWSYAYDLPAGWARVVPPTESGYRYGRPISHEVVGNQVYTDYGAPLPVIVIMDMSNNPGVWDDLMTEMVSCTLAMKLVNKFPAKAKFVELASQLLAQATTKAEEIDAYEGTQEPAESFDIIRARGTDPFSPRRW